MKNGVLPSGELTKSYGKWPIEIVDFPINSMVDLSMAKCKRSPEGKHGENMVNTW